MLLGEATFVLLVLPHLKIIIYKINIIDKTEMIKNKINEKKTLLKTSSQS